MAVSQACSSCRWQQCLREGTRDCSGAVSTSSQHWAPTTVIGGGGGGGGVTGRAGRVVVVVGGGAGSAGPWDGPTSESHRGRTITSAAVCLSEGRCHSTSELFCTSHKVSRQTGSDNFVRGPVRPTGSCSARSRSAKRGGRCLSVKQLRPCRRLHREIDEEICTRLSCASSLNLDCSICQSDGSSSGNGKTRALVQSTATSSPRRSGGRGGGSLCSSEWENYRWQCRQQQWQFVAQATRGGDPASTFLTLEAGDRDGSDRTLANQRFSEGNAAVNMNSSSVESTSSKLPGLRLDNRISLPAITEPVADDMNMLRENLKTIVGERHPMLLSAADQIFSAGGKRLRPVLVFLVSRATAELGGLENLLPQHRRLAEITEMIHTASLVHDDVLDDSNVRRGAQTVHNLYGTRVAVLVGDFLFAQSSWYLANLNNLEVIKLISQVIADFANGEIQQAASLFDCDLTLEGYMEKSYFKTASLMAASSKSGAIFSGVSEYVRSQMFDYGKHLGLAFQVVDDILDFTQSTEQLGKPAGSDLASGNLTAPALFAMKRDPKLRLLIETEFANNDSIQRAIELVITGGGIDDARKLAEEEGEKARNCLQCLPQSRVRQSLEGLVDYVLERLY